VYAIVIYDENEQPVGEVKLVFGKLAAKDAYERAVSGTVPEYVVALCCLIEEYCSPGTMVE
jgi:hypothetical protein